MQIGDLSKLYHVYVGEAVEATVAYASVNADTQLLDMPGGDAVADAKAGASMDVLGSITVDGRPLDTIHPAKWCAVTTGAFQDFAKPQLPAGETVGIGDLLGLS